MAKTTTEKIQNGLDIQHTKISKSATPLDKIDAVLHYFYENKNEPAIWDFHIQKSFQKPKRIDLTENEISSICSKLYNEGYLYCEQKTVNNSHPNTFPHYKINFDGELLYSQGGYRRLNLTSKIQSFAKLMQAVLLVLGSIATVVYTILEIMKYHSDCLCK